ncbi:2-C-methyl-D-erythritol 2,4-cyclodiphosphate synthase [Candidatus Methylacidithermus pantelleriae]|uniref:2-C-methyl-D-erythritol 2,4-cyclodiphosphate synthase n=1 Tax=Candidatus Methylacidithermus pantelleriae TaxID=2744239 RepID=A0A8J2BR13_9BACT|nr:2-C-methyl-D-erythritol 2,4-cyclodiphosphate synthase [Candidatus Methylacidithermus pantelleriae]CAF0700623.1 2-C-methyl-D-erythritol 2,4-cyclodiphosphate synthase [Candidatus Methylacidithermus pantelleriae]
MIRVGIGYDVHRLVSGRPLILGGVNIPSARGLEGHSDADCLIHAICDALLGAVGERDIGFYFSNRDSQWKDAPSRIFLEKVVAQLAKLGAKVVNIDATIVAEEPHLSPYIPQIKTSIAQIMDISIGQIGVKATTQEGMGFLGRGEGIAVWAVAAVELRETPC